MADIESGMYYVINMGASENSAEGNAFCLARRGGSASNANDMVIYRQNYHPTPVVSAVYVGTNDEISITAPSISGKIAAVPQSGMGTDSQSGEQYPKTNVIVKGEGNWGGRRGRWTMERIENIFLYYDGQPYPVYHLISAMSIDAHRACLWASGSSNGSVVKTAAPSDGTGSKSQYWAFIPVPSVPNGFYNIRLAVDPNRLLIGQSNGSLLLGSDTNRNDNRAVWVLSKDELEPDHQAIRNLEPIANDDPDSSYLMVPSGQAIEHGKPKIGRVRSGGHFDRWVFVARDQSAKYNDNTYQSYEMWSNAFDYSYWSVSRYVLTSVLQSMEGIQTYPEFMLVNAQFVGEPTDYQWFLTPAHAYDSKLTVPSRLGIEVDGVTEYGNVGFSGLANLYPTWVGGDNDGWQLRYRFVTCRYTDDSNSTNRNVEDTSWKSIFDEDSANEGWGDNEIYNCSATLTYNESNSAGKGAAGRYRADIPIVAQLGAGSGEMDRVYLEFQVRPWSYAFRDIEGLSAHGGSASYRFMLAYKPTLTLSNLRIDAYGIAVDYISDLHRGSNKIEITNMEIMSQIDYSGMADMSSSSVRYNRMRNQKKCDMGTAGYSGTYYADFGNVIPAVNSEILLGWKITSVDGIVNSGVSLVPVASSDFSNAESVTLPTEFLENGSRILKVDCQNNGVSYFENRSAIAWLTINHRPGGTSDPSQFIANDENSKYLETIQIARNETEDGDYFAIPYPFRKPFKVTVLGNGANDVAKRFEYYHAAFDDFRDRTRMWNYGSYVDDSEWYEIFVNEAGNPTETVTTALTSQATKTTERKWEIVQFGNTPEQPRSVSGVVYPGIMPDYIQRTENFSKCKFAWYRSFDGEVIRVAVTSVRETRTNWGDAITIEMRRTDV